MRSGGILFAFQRDIPRKMNAVYRRCGIGRLPEFQTAIQSPCADGTTDCYFGFHKKST